MRKMPVLFEPFIQVLTFQTGHFDSDLSPVLVDEKIFSQENAVTVARVGVFALGALLLMFLQCFPYAVFTGKEKE